MSNRLVKYAKFHQGLFIPGFGTIGDTLPSASKSLKLVMTYSADGLYVSVNGHEALVPPANVALVVFSPEAAKAVA